MDDQHDQSIEHTDKPADFDFPPKITHTPAEDVDDDVEFVLGETMAYQNWKARAGASAGKLAAAALEYVAAGEADQSMPQELRELPEDQRAELLAEAGKVREAAEGATHDQELLETLAADCQRGAEELTYEAEHAAEVLATRAGGASADPQEWADRKRAAAATARAYADRLRAEARLLGASGRAADADLVHQAVKVALAANTGGTLVDSSATFVPAERRSVTEGYHQRKRAAIEGSGLFTHVAEPGQVPYWQLGADVEADSDTAAATPQPSNEEPDYYGVQRREDRYTEQATETAHAQLRAGAALDRLSPEPTHGYADGPALEYKPPDRNDAFWAEPPF